MKLFIANKVNLDFKQFCDNGINSRDLARMFESNTIQFGHMFKIDSIFIIPYP